MSSGLDEPSTGRGLGVKVAIGVVAVLGLLALVVTIPSNDDPDVAAAPTGPPTSGPTDTAEVPVDPAAPPAETEDPGDGDGDSVCGMPAGSQAVPVQAPDVEWELVGAIAVPTDPAIGPGLVENGLRRCYARNPTGALFAALTFLAQMTNIDTTEQAIRELTAQGPGRELLLGDLQADPPRDTGNNDGPLAIAGYSFFNYNEDLTTVDLLFQLGVDGFIRIPVTMRWEDGDWKLEVPGTGDPLAGFEPLTSTAGYTRWGP